MTGMSGMSGFEERAHRAGEALRAWAPTSPATPTELAGRAVRRSRRRRAAAAGSLVAGTLAVVGLSGRLGDGGNDVETAPATSETTGRPTPSTTESTSSTPTPSSSTTASTATTSTATAPPATPATCTGELSGFGVPYTVTLPEGWHFNEAWTDGTRSVAACTLFGAEPLELSPSDEPASPAVVNSNADVWLFQPYLSEGKPPGTFEEHLASGENALGHVATQRTTIDGRPAARVESVEMGGDGTVAGTPWFRWEIDLGDVWISLSSGDASPMDEIAQGLRFSE